MVIMRCENDYNESKNNFILKKKGMRWNKTKCDATHEGFFLEFGMYLSIYTYDFYFIFVV